MQNLSGRKLGNYELRERLGRGGMAEVYKAYQPSMDRFVAVKVMLGHLAEDDTFIERFKREAQAVGKLRHPHIIDIFDFGIEEDVYYMAMEYLTDDNLKEYIDSHEKLPLEDTLKITRDLADALDYAHKSGMIHRDMKPANVMFLDKAKLNVVLTDFGIAKILNAAGLTGTGMAVGTPAYMSPEAGAGSDADERADIYALGIILYEMLVGKVPYNADTPLAVIMKHINAPLPTSNDYGDDIPEPVERIMLKCLAKDPDDRYSKAGELRDALNGVLSQADNLAKTESVKAKQVDTEIAATNKTPKPVVIADDAPTTSVNWADTEAIPEETSSGNSMMMFAGITVIAIVILAGLFLFRDTLFGTGDEIEPTAVAEVIATEETTAVPDEATDAPQPTAVPEEATDIPAPTDVPAPANLLDPIAPPHEFNLALLSWDINPDDARNIEFEVEQMLFDSQLEDALRRVEDVLSSDFTDMPDYATRVRIAVATNDFDTALETGEFMLALDPNNPHAYINLLDALYMSSPDIDHDRALSILEEGQALEPENWSFIWRRIPLVDNPAEKMTLFNNAENDGARGWRFVLFAGNFLSEQGEYQRAIPYLEAAIHLPPHIFAQSRRVDSQLRYAQAQLEYMAANPDYPLSLGGEMPANPINLSIFSHINPILDEAEVMLLAGDIEAAIEFTTAILEDDPDNFDALFARAQVHAQNWDPDNLAGQDAQRLIELQPDNALGYLALSDSWFNYPLYGEEGSVEEGISILQQAFELEPENPHVLFRVARSGEWELEPERMLRAEELGASGYRFIYNMGEFLQARGFNQRAIPYWEIFNRYTEQNSYLNGESFWALLGTLIQLGEQQTAFDHLMESDIIFGTDDPEVFALASVIAYEAGEFAFADEWANTALALSSEAYSAHYVVGALAYWRDGDADVAIERFNMIVEDNGFLRFRTYGLFADMSLESARILVDAGRMEEALEYYNRAIEDVLYEPSLYEERANIYLELDDIEAARADLRESFALETDPEIKDYYRERLLDLGPASDD